VLLFVHTIGSRITPPLPPPHVAASSEICVGLSSAADYLQVGGVGGVGEGEKGGRTDMDVDDEHDDADATTAASTTAAADQSPTNARTAAAVVAQSSNGVGGAAAAFAIAEEAEAIDTLHHHHQQQQQQQQQQVNSTTHTSSSSSCFLSSSSSSAITASSAGAGRIRCNGSYFRSFQEADLLFAYFKDEDRSHLSSRAISEGATLRIYDPLVVSIRSSSTSSASTRTTTTTTAAAASATAVTTTITNSATAATANDAISSDSIEKNRSGWNAVDGGGGNGSSVQVLYCTQVYEALHLPQVPTEVINTLDLVEPLA